MTSVESDRRRSRRIPAAVPLQAEWELAGKPVCLRGETEMISAYGALIRIKTEQPMPTHLTLKNPATRKTSPAEVLYVVNPGTDGSVRVALALEMPGEEFWGADFSSES